MAYAIFDTPAIHGIPGIKELAQAGGEMVPPLVIAPNAPDVTFLDRWPTPLSSIQNPVFSPDGSRIAFTAVDDFAGTSGAYVVDAADGGNLGVLTDRPVTLTDWLAN